MNALHALSSNLLKGVLQIAWPVFCPVCGKLGEPLCPDCLDAQAQTLPRFCLLCGLGEPCGLHPGAPLCHVGTRYGGHAREIVHRMKYAGCRRIAFMMGRTLAARFARPDANCLVPVPLHRMSEREYNQAEWMARGASVTWRIPAASLLVWARASRRQVEKAADRALPGGAIAMNASAPGVSKVFLIDDVYTTGATLRSAYEALSDGGLIVTGAMVWSRTGG